MIMYNAAKVEGKLRSPILKINIGDCLWLICKGE